jgi:hypothetical protein
MVRTARGLFVVLVSLCLLSAGTGSAGADDSQSLLRIAHLSSDTPAVDVAVAALPVDGAALIDPGPDLARGLGYGDVGQFHELPAGAYAISLRPAGTDRSTPPALTARVDLPADGARTVAITGTFADLSLVVLPDDLTSPPAGSARVRVLSAAGDTVDVGLAGGAPLAAGLHAGDAAPPAVVPAGPATLRVENADADLLVEFAAGSVVTVVVLDRPDGSLALRVVLDAAAPARVPTGAVEAGSGPGGLPVGLLAAGLVAAAAALRGRRRLVLVTAGVVLSGLLSVPVAAAGNGRSVALEPDALESDARPSRAAPTWLRVPAAGVDVDLPAAGLDTGGALIPPAVGAGWYADGPAPGEVGPAVITGHVDWAGSPAAFAELGTVAAGDEILVDHADGTTTRFTVTRVGRYPKTEFPTAAVYGPTPFAELRLITCGGTFDRAAGSYRDNVVVYAIADS